MKTDNIYRFRLQKLAKHLETGQLGHERFDFAHVSAVVSCKTVGCAIGELPYVFPDEWKMRIRFNPLLIGSRSCSTEYDACQFFGIDGVEYEQLFIPIDFVFPNAILPKTATRYDVAANIRAFIKEQFPDDAPRIPTTVAVLLACLCIVMPASAQNLIVNGSFETPHTRNAVTILSMAPWQSEQDGMWMWGDGLPGRDAAAGRQYINPITIWQTVPTLVGERYRLGFYHAPWPGAADGGINVSLNGSNVVQLADDGRNLGNTVVWSRWETNFVATSNQTTLRFDGRGTGGAPFIDSVWIEYDPFTDFDQWYCGVRTSQVEVSWPSLTNRTYQVQFRTKITDGWAPLGTPRTGTGGTDRVYDATTNTARIYRVISLIP